MANIKDGRNEYRIIAYLSDSGVWNEQDIDAEKLTHINYAFGLIENGKVQGRHLKKLDKLYRVKRKNPELKTLISIGGWGAEGFSDAALTEESRNAFAESAIDFMMNNGFDGIDIDWEYPCCDQAGIIARPSDRENFTLLLKVLREKLESQGMKEDRYYLLTIALGADQKYIDDIEMEIIYNYLDFINIMTYDMRGSFTNITGHHSNLFSPNGDMGEKSVDAAVNALLSAGVPHDKIVIGAAFYGRLWQKVKNENNGLNISALGTGCLTRSYSELAEKYINRNGFTRYWDGCTKSPYLFDGSTFISYDDEESLEHKSKYIIDRNIGGIMFWEYSLDNTRRLINSIHSILGGKACSLLKRE